MDVSMTAREYAAANGVSLSTAYRRLKARDCLQSDRKGPGKGRRTAVDWHSDVVRGLAKQSATAAEFQAGLAERLGKEVGLSTARRWRSKLFAESA